MLLAASFGSFAGAGMFAFSYGEGASYFSDKPENCTNCHIMQPYFDSWVKSSHHIVATCVDCHLPHDFAAKYVAKADNGFFHSWAFTFENFHEPIQIKTRNRRIVQQNCVSCHSELVHEMLPSMVSGEAVSCVDCHAGVGHAGAWPRSTR
jgi:cytochrome c nitrite reductase small subunit